MIPLVDTVRATPVVICAHRGASGSAPENTLAAITAAIDCGATMIEIDIQITRDNRIVVFHDEDLSRTTNGTGDIRDTLYDDVRTLDAGSWFDARFSNEHIPLLDEALALIKGRAYLNIELKPMDVSERTSQILDEVLARIDAQEMLDTTVFSSFDHRIILHLKSIRPDVRTLALNVPGDTRLPHDVVSACRADAFGCSLEELNPDLMEDCTQHMIPVGVYTINTREDLITAINLGVRGVVTNFPDRLQNVLTDLNMTSHNSHR